MKHISKTNSRKQIAELIIDMQINSNITTFDLAKFAKKVYSIGYTDGILTKK